MDDNNKEFTYIYQHNNGSFVYEAKDGEKYIKYDDLYFSSIAEVNDYIKRTGIKKWRQD